MNIGGFIRKQTTSTRAFLDLLASGVDGLTFATHGYGITFIMRSRFYATVASKAYLRILGLALTICSSVGQSRCGAPLAGGTVV